MLESSYDDVAGSESQLEFFQQDVDVVTSDSAVDDRKSVFAAHQSSQGRLVTVTDVSTSLLQIRIR